MLKNPITEQFVLDIVSQVRDQGIDNIRCALTGQIIGYMSTESVAASIEYELFEDINVDSETILDTLQTRWLIQSKPAPHLTGNNGPRLYEFLLANNKLELLAMLAGKLIFENLVALRSHGTKALAMQKAQWLSELWDTESQIGWSDLHEVTLNTLIRLDAIHSIRDCLFSNDVRTDAETIRENDYTFDSLSVFVSKVEDAAFLALSRMASNPARGNPAALRAAMLQSGMTPDQIVEEEEKALRESEAKRRHYQSLGAQNAGKSGTVKIHRGLKPTLGLRDLGATIPASLAAKYESELANRKGQSTAKGKSAKSGEKEMTASQKKAAARFNLTDFDFSF